MSMDGTELLHYKGNELKLEDLIGNENAEDMVIKGKVVQVPLHKTEQDKIDRIVAYKKVRKDIQQWQPLVDHNKRSRQLDLPFQKEKHNNVTIASLAIGLHAENEFEKEIMELEMKTGMNEKMVSERDEATLNSITEEEVRERIKELRRLRELTFRYDTKMKRHKRIKSRKYRQILGKEKMRNSVKNLSITELQELSGSAGNNEIEELNFKRAEERLTLRHKDLGKWSKMIKKRGSKDPVTRKAIAEHLQRHEELKRKMSGEEEIMSLLEKEEPKESSVMDNLMDLSFMQNELVAKNASSDEDLFSVDEEEYDSKPISETYQEIGIKSSANDVLNNLNSQFHFKVAEESNVFKNKKRAVAQVIDGVELDDDPFEGYNESSNVIVEEELDSDGSKSRSSNESNPWMSGIQNYPENNEVFEIEASAPLEINEDQKALVQEAFDDAADEFKKEKKEIEDHEGDKVIDLTLPGWGTWGGLNSKPRLQNIKTKTVKGISKASRHDRKREKVIIREKRSKLVDKYLIKKIPYPYKSAKEYEGVLNCPSGKEWNTHNNYAKVNKPRVETRLGKIIMPLRLSAKNSLTHDKEALSADLLSSDDE
eukprot:NODE_269_length_12236_cov_0.516932.p1 type:complete len:596 gc:universal NODE_269_length_12236_cov_0.516932:6510-8297(+)